MQELLRRVTFLFLAIGTLVSVSVAVKCGLPRMEAWQENRAEQARLEAEVDTVRRQITATKRNIDRFRTSPYFVERLARTNHRVAENEVLFILE